MNSPVHIVMVTHGDRRYVERTIPALLETTYPFLLTVVANAPSPALERKLLDFRGETVTIVSNDRNLGYPRAANQAWRVQETLAINTCIVGDDCLALEPDWLRKLVDLTGCCPEVGIAGHSVEASWPLRQVGPPDCRRTVQVQPSGLGGVYLIPHRTWLKCGYFNEELGPYAEEDALYGWKVRRAGMLCAYFDHSVLGRSFEHLGTPDTQSEQYLKWKQRRRERAIVIRDQLIREYEAGRPLNS